MSDWPAALALPLEPVSRLTGLSQRQLRRWDVSGFFRPTYADENRRRPYSRLYSFRDLVSLKALALIRDKVSPEELRKASDFLGSHDRAPWSALTLYLSGQRVYFEDPGSSELGTHRINLADLAQEMNEAVRRLSERRPEDVGQITRSPAIQGNAPVIAGTRIPTWAIREYDEAGYTMAALLRQFPSLQPDDIRAALEYEERRPSVERAG